MLLIHIAIALLSLVATTISYVVPTRVKLYISALMVMFTLATGSYLVMSTHSPLLSSCMSGLVYLSIVSVGLAGAWRRLVTQED
jgi:hypothetical protein